MSFNRLKYDKCAYQFELNQSMGTADWIMDPNRFENTNKCRVEFGLVGGTNVSHAKGNLVDLESDLIGTTRVTSKCPTEKYLNPCATSNTIGECQPNKIIIKQTPHQTGRVVDTTPIHLGTCQMVNYKNKLPNRYFPFKTKKQNK